jgi:ABC-type multidrug transport system fused ATPase/permease subunit
LWILGAIVGLLSPVVLLLLGWAVELLARHDGQMPTDRLNLGAILSLKNQWIGADISPLRGVTTLLAGVVLLGLVQSGLLWLLYRMASQRAIDKSVDLYRSLFRKGSEQAMVQSVSGQQDALRKAISSDLPIIREAMLRWHRSMPRHVVQWACCLIVSVLVHPMLTVLSILCLGILGQIYRWTDRHRRSKLPVLRERAYAASERVHELCESGPLLASVHDSEASTLSFESSLQTFRDAERALAFTSLWKTPLMLTSTVLIVGAMGFVLAVQMVQGPNGLSAAACLVLIAAQLGAMLGWMRMVRMWQGLKVGRDAASSALAVLDQTTPVKATDSQLVMPQLREHVVLDHVTLKDSNGRKLLEDVSARMRPGQLVSILAADRLQARALAELILGFGRPSSGRMLFDASLSTDLDPESVRNQSVWIAADGPLVAGSLQENLQPNGRPIDAVTMQEAIRAAGLYDTIQNLADGLGTLVSPHDDRLQPDSLFRLGVVRAILKKPSIVVAEEPEARVTMATETDTFSALQQLTSKGMLVVVIPNRLSTLRNADQIIVIHDHRVSASGTHAQLLETSELYRHLNYVRFSPLRHVAV